MVPYRTCASHNPHQGALRCILCVVVLFDVCMILVAQVNTTLQTLTRVQTNTIFVRANILFPKFHLERTNAEGTSPQVGKNLFSLNDMLTGAGISFDDIAQTGAIIMMYVNYDCDLNTGADSCQPTFQFTRMDEGLGFQYTRAIPLAVLPPARSLQTIRGVRIDFALTGKAGRFSLPLLVLGASI